MPLLHYRVRYFINDLWIHPELLGWKHTYTDGDATVTVALPSDDVEFSARKQEQELDHFPCVKVAKTIKEPGWSHETIEVVVFQVSVDFEASLDGEVPGTLDQTHPFWQQVSDAEAEGQRYANAAGKDFLRWVRASSRQPWLGLISELPRQFGRAGIGFADGRPIRAAGPLWSHLFQSSRLRLEAGDMPAIAQALELQKPVPIHSELLSDALFLDEGTGSPDLKRAVITAAIACEVRVEEVLTARVAPEREKLFRMLLGKSSNVALILGDIMEAAFDTSLEKSDPELWARVDKLRHVRNKVVHEGVEVDMSVLGYRPAQIAVDLFTWLDENVTHAKAPPAA